MLRPPCRLNSRSRSQTRATRGSLRRTTHLPLHVPSYRCSSAQLSRSIQPTMARFTLVIPFEDRPTAKRVLTCSASVESLMSSRSMRPKSRYADTPARAARRAARGRGWPRRSTSSASPMYGDGHDWEERRAPGRKPSSGVCRASTATAYVAKGQSMEPSGNNVDSDGTPRIMGLRPANDLLARPRPRQRHPATRVGPCHTPRWRATDALPLSPRKPLTPAVIRTGQQSVNRVKSSCWIQSDSDKPVPYEERVLHAPVDSARARRGDPCGCRARGALGSR